jgi:hypothetical protein
MGKQMKPLLVAMTLLAIGCGETSTSDAPSLLSIAAGGNPKSSFIVGVVFEPAAGVVSSYTFEGRPAGSGQFTGLTQLSDFVCVVGSCVDLTQIVPHGGPVELRVRADPGGFESNVVQYDPGTK